MARFRCAVWKLYWLVLVFLIGYTRTADPNVEEVSEIDGVKLKCPVAVPSNQSVIWKGPDDTQLNFDNGTFVDSRLSLVNETDLQIANAVPADNGIYTCVVGSEEGTVNLTVYAIDLPKVQISFKDQVFDSSTGLYQIRGNIDEMKTATCMVKRAFPLPEVYLTMKYPNNTIATTINTAELTIDTRLESDNTYSVNASINYTLFRLDNNKIFECNAFFQVDGNNNTATGSARIYILEVTPSISVINGFQTLSPMDDMLHLECSIERGRPNTTAITFYVDGQPVSQPYNFNQTQVMCSEIQEPDKWYSYLYACHSNMTIQLSKMDNGKSIYCEFMYLNQTILSAKEQAEFRFPPTMVNISGNTPLELSGEMAGILDLTCMTDSSNNVSTIEWYLDSMQLTATEAVEQLQGDYNGVITKQNIQVNVTRSMDRKTITCQAYNFYNRDDKVSASITLNVSYSPLLIEPSASIYRVYTGESIRITCSAEAKPMAETKWFYMNSPTNKTEVTSVFQLSLGGTVLDLTDIQTSHGGQYECQATNMIMPNVSAMITLEVFDKSTLEPYLIKTMTPAATSIVFAFTLPTDRNIQSLSLRYYPANNQGMERSIPLTVPASGNEASVTVDGLQPSTTYEFYLREMDGQYGLEATTFLQSVSTTEAEDDDGFSRSDLNRAILISVFVTAGVVAILCIIIFCIVRRGGCSSSSKEFDLQMKPRA